MLLKVYKLKFLLAMLLVPFLAVAQPTGWEVQTTPFQHFITVNSATLNAVGLPALEDGDYIGVFFDNGLTCGGYIEVNLAVSQSLNAYGESVFPMPTPGFGNGESFTWKFYDNSASEEYDFSPVMTGAQVWTLNGQSVLTTLNADFVITATAVPTGGGFFDLAYSPLGDSQTWYDGDMMVISTDATVNVEVLETTVFTVEALSAGEPASASITVNVSAFTAGPDVEVCEDSPSVLLDGALATPDYIGISWTTSGTGTFTNGQTINPTYTPSQADLDGGMVTLTVSAFNNAVLESDDMELSFAPVAEITMFPDKLFLCANADIILDAPFDFAGLVEVENYSLIQWADVNGAGGFTNENTPEPIYNPTDIGLTVFDNDGTPTILTMQVFSNLPCIIDQWDSVNLVYVRAPETVFAGDPVEICIHPVLESYTFDDAEVVWGANPWFDGIVQPELNNNITWTSDGDGTWENENTANPTYYFSAAELAGTAGTINFTLTAETMEACGPVTAETSIVLQSPPTVNIIPADTIICEDPGIFDFANLVEYGNYDAIQWASINGGTAGFAPNETVEFPTYTPDFLEFQQGFVQLVVNVSAIDPCAGGASDIITIYFQKNPVVDAGENDTICANETFTTNPDVQYSNGPFEWTQVGGAGDFDDPTLLNATYTAVNPDDAGATVFMTLTAQAISPCTVTVENTVELTILCAPDVWAGDDMTVCETENPELVGVASCVSQTMWATTGDGYFCCPDDLITTYYPGPNDKLGCVTLVLIGYPEAPCSMYELDKVNVCFDPAPMVDAGPDKTVCEGETIQLDGLEMNTCGVQWSVIGGNGYFSDELIANPTYTPNGQDLIAGEVELVIFGSGCDACTGELAADTMLLTIQKLPVVDIEEDETTICEDQTFDPADYMITVENYTTSAWSTSGDGTFDMDNIYTPGVGDIAAELAVLTLTAQPIDPCTAEASDDIIVNIQYLPTVNIIPADTTICEVPGIFCFTPDIIEYGNYDAIQWASINGGSVNFDDENAEYPCYTADFLELQQGFVELVVNASAISPCVGLASDIITIYFQPVVNIEIEQAATICEDATYTPAPYVIENACGVEWTTDGDGMFDDATAEYPVYTPGVTDIANGGVLLHVTGMGCYDCGDLTQDIYVTIQYNPIADAGDDGVVCEYICNQSCPPYENGIYTDLSGSVEYASSFEWSTDGDGLFIPGNNVLDPDYMLGDGDIADPDGEVVLCLTAQAIDPCTVAAEDCMTLTIQPFPTANAGPDQSICEGETAQLDGSAENFDGVFWDFALYGEGDGTWNNQIILNPVYTPGPEDIALGHVELIMVAFPISPCTYPDADNMKVTIIPQPIADAGVEFDTICAGETYQLAGSVTNATGGSYWTGPGTFDPDSSSLTAVFTPNADAIAAGFAELCLYALDGSACQADYFDCMTLTILPPPLVSAGDDQTTCEDLPIVLNGSASNYDYLEWSGGDGTFVPVDEAVTTYTPGTLDAGDVTLTITAYPTSPCTVAFTDEMILTIQELPVVDAGADGVICAYETFTTAPVITTTNAYTVEWTHNGNGMFADATLDNAIYTPGPGDAGTTIMLTLTVTPGDFCTTLVTDYLELTINEEPALGFCFNGDLADTGEEYTICYDDMMTVTLCEVWAGTGPFDIEYSLNGAAPVELTGVVLDDTLYNNVLPVGDNTIEIVSITDANGCSAQDVTPYMATVVVGAEPTIAVTFNGATPLAIEELCWDDNFEICLAGVDGDADWDVEWTVTGPMSFAETTTITAAGECFAYNAADFVPGTYDLAVVSLTDNLGCTASQATLDSYAFSIEIKPEPTMAVTFNGTTPMAMQELCWDDDFEICMTGVVGVPDWAVEWTVTGPMNFTEITTITAAGECFAYNAADFLPGTYNLAVVSLTDDMGCDASQATLDSYAFQINIQAAPTVEPIDDMTSCATQGIVIPVTAVVANTNGVSWSVDPMDAGYFDDASLASTNFNPTRFDVVPTICVEVLPINPPCTNSVTECFDITFIPTPVAFAGADATICESNGEYELADAFADNYSTLLWTTGGDGTFSDDMMLNPTYYPGAGDILNGAAVLCLEAQPLAGCDVAAYVCMNLTIIPDPAITPEGPFELTCENYDFVMGEWLPYALEPEVIGGATYQWSVNGDEDGFFADPTALNTTYTLGDLYDKWNGMVTLTLTVNGAGNCGVTAVQDFVLLVPQQIIEISETNFNGLQIPYWRGISSYVDKSTTSVEEVMDPVVLVPGSQSLVIMINKQGTSFWPEPVPAINNLGNWDAIGYQAKFKDYGCLPIYGDNAYDTTGRNFLVDGPFTYLPVLTNDSVRIQTMFADHIDDIVLIYDWYQFKTWFNVGDTTIAQALNYITPGNAYLMVNKGGFTPYEITFPNINLSGSIVSTSSTPAAFTDNSSPWNDVVNTAHPHFIFFADEVLAMVEPGDVFGAFNQYNECVGLAELENRDDMFKLLAMGDDPVSEEIEGFEIGENMNFKLYRPSTGETFNVSFTYDPEYPSYDNQFAVYGVSRVVDLTMNVTSIGEGFTNNNINVYPNPATDVVNVASDINITSVTLVNMVGQVVYSDKVNGTDLQINVSNFVTGIYMLHLETVNGNVVTKRISVE